MECIFTWFLRKNENTCFKPSSELVDRDMINACVASHFYMALVLLSNCNKTHDVFLLHPFSEKTIDVQFLHLANAWNSREEMG